MKLGIGHSYFREKNGTQNVEKGAVRMRTHGYEYLDFNETANTDGPLYAVEDEREFIKKVEEWKELLAACGLKVYQIHGPWSGDRYDKTPEGRENRFEKMSLSLLAASILGARYMAIHPLMPFGMNSPDHPDEVRRINVDFYRRLSRVAAPLGVTICLENMPFPDYPFSDVPSIVSLIREIDCDNVRMCLDVGHANIFPMPLGECVRYVGRELLCILHIHDNMGEIDEHRFPYDGTADLDGFAQALREIGFDGVINIETDVRWQDDKTEAEHEARERDLASRAMRVARIAQG